MRRDNSLKRKLGQGYATNAAWVFTADVDAAEVLGTCGFDAIILDRQHTPISLDKTREQVRAVQAAGDSTVLVRLRQNSASEIAVLLDMGVEGLLLPDAQGVEDVRTFIASTRYPPHGIRGAHDTVARAAGWGTRTADYREHYVEELLLIAMVESAQGARNVRDMCHVPGLNMIFIGPLDLSASVGNIGDWEDPRYLNAMLDIERRVLQEGALLGGAIAPPGDAAAWHERGHRLLSIGNDVSMIRGAARQLLDAFKSDLEG